MHRYYLIVQLVIALLESINQMSSYQIFNELELLTKIAKISVSLLLRLKVTLLFERTITKLLITTPTPPYHHIYKAEKPSVCPSAFL